MNRPRSSRALYRRFVEDYKHRRLEDPAEGAGQKPARRSFDATWGARSPRRAAGDGGKRRVYLREYLRWLWPFRYGIALVFVLAAIAAGLQMVEPLFMRFIIDQSAPQHSNWTRRLA